MPRLYRITSNNRRGLAPMDALAGCNGLFGGYQPLIDGRLIEKLDVVGQGLQALGRNAVNGLLDLSAEFDSGHDSMIKALPRAGHRPGARASPPALNVMNEDAAEDSRAPSGGVAPSGIPTVTE